MKRTVGSAVAVDRGTLYATRDSADVRHKPNGRGNAGATPERFTPPTGRERDRNGMDAELQPDARPAGFDPLPRNDPVACREEGSAPAEHHRQHSDEKGIHNNRLDPHHNRQHGSR